MFESRNYYQHKLKLVDVDEQLGIIHGKNQI